MKYFRAPQTTLLLITQKKRLQSTQCDENTTRYDGRSALYEDEIQQPVDELSTRFDDYTTRDTQYYDEETLRYGEESTAGQEDHAHYDHDHTRNVPTKPPELNASPLMPLADDDSIDDPFGHPLEDPYFYARRPPATTPGAVAVVRRGYEESDLHNDDEWDPTAPADMEEGPSRNESHARTYLDAAVTPVMKNLHDMSTRRMLTIAAIAFVILGGAGAGIAVALTDNNDSPASAPAPSPPMDICDFTNNANPDPIQQCACHGNISVLTDEVRATYDGLKETFIPSLFPEGFDYPTDSCEPPNAALIWLAAEEGDRPSESRRNRYLLSLLYPYWQGLEWTKTMDGFRLHPNVNGQV